MAYESLNEINMRFPESEVNQLEIVWNSIGWNSCNLQPTELLKMENSIYKSKLTPLRQRNPIKTVCSRQKRIRSYRTYKQKLASLTLEANIEKASIG